MGCTTTNIGQSYFAKSQRKPGQTHLYAQAMMASKDALQLAVIAVLSVAQPAADLADQNKVF